MLANTIHVFQATAKLRYLKTVTLFICALISQKAGAQFVGRTNEGFHIINKQGEKLTNAYDFIQYAEQEPMLAAQNGKFGYLSADGRIAIPLNYDIAYPFDGDFALVGNSGKYYHINQANQILDSLDWPQAPLVYNRHFLVVNQNENKVYYNNGTEMLSSNHPLSLAPKGGIIGWNAKKDTVFQYTSPYGNKELKLANVFPVIGAPTSTYQGYLCITQLKEGKEIYAVYDQYGTQLVSCDKAGVDPSGILAVWNEFVYVPVGNPYFRPTAIGQEMHFPMNELWIKGRNSKSPFDFHLCNTYADAQMILLKNSDKWLPFNGREVKGNNLFDDVVPGDDHFTPVKMGQNWYLLDRRRDSLIPLPYKQIHPIGMNKGRFFARMQEDGNINDTKWAFVNYYYKTVSEELYQVPLLPLDYSPYGQKSRYDWPIQMNEVIKNGKRVILDYKGNEVWTDPDNNPPKLEDYFKIKFAFQLDGFKDVSKKNGYPKNQTSLVIGQIASGILVKLINTKKTEVPVDVQDGYLKAILEMKTKDGKWLAIGFLDPSSCGNSYYTGYFPANKTASTVVNLPKGDQTITVRVVLNKYADNPIVSNEIQVNTNSARLWVDKYCGGFGCTMEGWK